MTNYTNLNADKINILDNIQFRLFLGSSGALLVFKLLFSGSELIVYKLVTDLLIISAISFLFLFLMDIFEKRNASPFSLIMNIGILNAFVFFLIMFSDSIMSLLFENVNEKLNNPSLVSNIITLLYILLIVGFIIYVFIALRHLFFFRQSSAQKIYFYTMLVFFVLASLTAQYFGANELSFISDTFMIISVLLMLLNSLRISWIAFIVKKEKIALLVLSIVIAVLFIVNLNNSGDATVHSKMLSSISPSLKEFTEIIMLYAAIYFSVLFFTTLFHIPTAEAFDRKAEEVSSLQYFSKLITQVLEYNELADTVTDITIRVSGANASWIIWREKDEFISLANKNIGFIDSNLLNKFILRKVDWENLDDTIFLKLSDIEVQSKLSQKFRAMEIS
ncbi:MAG: hypothetical protein IIB08_03075 [Bacteroidetes bacterium]|nr:hypothetical protein [Bacteroidota bacterium]